MDSNRVPSELAAELMTAADRHLCAKAARLAETFALPLADVHEVLGLPCPAARGADVAPVAPAKHAPVVGSMLAQQAAQQAAAKQAAKPAVAKPAEPKPASVDTKTCTHYVRGKNPHVCGRKAAAEVGGVALCTRHAKAAQAKAPKPPKPEPNLARKVQAKKAQKVKKPGLFPPLNPSPTGVRTFEVVERNGRYFDEKTRICLDPKRDNIACGSLNEDDRTLAPFTEAQIAFMIDHQIPYDRTMSQPPLARAPGAAVSDRAAESESEEEEFALRSDSEYVSDGGGDEEEE